MLLFISEFDNPPDLTESWSSDRLFSMSYLLLEHEDRQRAIDAAVVNLRLSGLDFDTIVACGLSGALVAPAVAARLDKQLVFVRKGESSHGHQVEIEGVGDVGNYVIVDDLVEYGKTVKRIRQALDGETKYGGRLVGVYFYNQSYLAPFFENFKAENKGLWAKAWMS